MYGYADKWVDINLSTKAIEFFNIPEEILRDYLGGVGIGAKLLYERVGPHVEWNDEDNCVIIACGPLNSSKIPGSGAHCVVTKGPLTNGAASSQAMGFFGAYLPMSGFDGMVIHGKSDTLIYLYIHDGDVEIRDAQEMADLNTLKTEEKIKELINRPAKASSVYSIGPAGENLVRFAAVVGDNGHVNAHNGIGAVWGSKNLKAIAVDRGKTKIPLFDQQQVMCLLKQMIKDTQADKKYKELMDHGTSGLFKAYTFTGLIPYKNLTSCVLPESYYNLRGEYYRERYELKRETCYACPSSHCNIIKITEGRYKGFIGEEPEYELMAGMGSMIGNPDPGAAVMLANQWDWMGMDGNEGSWLTAFVMEAFEKGILTIEDTDGIVLNWGNVEAVNILIKKIAHREGFGNLLAEGIKRSAEAIGGEALKIAVYQQKGHAPRGHDHRARWLELFDTAVSNTGTIETTHVALPPDDAFSPEAISTALYRGKIRNFVDSLVVCMFPTRTMISTNINHLTELISAATGWDYTVDEAFNQALRTVNTLRAFNIMHGIGPEQEYPSKRYASVPVDGPIAGKNIMDIWEETLDKYYELMGWNRKTGKPNINTLLQLGLDHIVADLYTHE